MKKLLLLMAGCAALFSSCLKGYEGTSAPSTLPYYSLYINTMNQGVFSLDPFDVAFRLNTLIVEETATTRLLLRESETRCSLRERSSATTRRTAAIPFSTTVGPLS
ncbi:MAG: hypothetical protein ACLR76_02095 [Alistipes sp.]